MRLCQLMIIGKVDQGSTRSEAQFVVDRAHVGVDGEGADDQLFGDLGVG